MITDKQRETLKVLLANPEFPAAIRAALAEEVLQLNACVSTSLHQETSVGGAHTMNAIRAAAQADSLTQVLAILDAYSRPPLTS